MATRRIQQLAGIAVGIAAAGLCTAPSAHAVGVHVVMEGQSIQKAVDAARPGDTVLVLPGTYQESVRISTPNLTLRGSGPKTVIAPPAVTPTATGPDSGSSDACARAGDGICVTGTAGHRVAGVDVESLTVRGATMDGVAGSETQAMTVRHVVVRNSGRYGISQEKSVQGRLVRNEATDNTEAGIFLANFTDAEGGALDTEGTAISGNTVSGNRIGVVVRRVRDMTVSDNVMTGNCGGVFVVGDEGVPRGGDLTVSDNEITANNKFCAATSRLPVIQGTGVVLTGVERTVVTGNEITDNVGTSPLSGGIVLFRSFTGGLNSSNTIENNVAMRNGPADLADRDAGPGNTFTGNSCQVSVPAGRC